jgi:hypothetical protein
LEDDAKTLLPSPGFVRRILSVLTQRLVVSVKVAEGYGGVGLLTDPARVDSTLAEAKAIAKGGRPVAINVHLRATDFRKGSISM